MTIKKSLKELQDELKELENLYQDFQDDLEHAQAMLEETEEHIFAVEAAIEQETQRLAVSKRMGINPDSTDPMQLSWL